MISVKNAIEFDDYAVGVAWDYNAESPVLRRWFMAGGFEQTIDFDANPFNHLEPWKSMVRQNQNDAGVVTAKFGDVSYAEDGSNGQVTVPINSYYYRKWRDTANGRMIMAVSPKGINGFKFHPFCIRNGVLKPRINVGAFQASFYDVSGSAYADYYVGAATPYTDDDGDADGTPTGTTPDTTATSGDKLASVAGRFPLTRLTRASFRTLAANRGSNWTQLDSLTRDAVNLLYTVEFANLNGQAALGQGVCSKTWNGTFKAEKSGLATYSLAYPSYGITTDGLHPMCFRGIENWWGNVWQWADGINIKADRNPWIADHGYADNKFESPYWDTGLTLGDTNGYISNIHDSPDWAFLPSSVAGGGETKYFCDYYYYATSNRVVCVGGDWNSDGRHGPFRISISFSSAYSHITIGGRLQCS